MKNIYSITITFLLLLSISAFGQERIYSPALSAPENGELDQAPDVLLDWNAVTGDTLVIRYEVQLSRSEDFADPVTYPLTDVTSYQMANLEFGGIYYWHVRAYDHNNISDWSETWSFGVINTIELKQPLDNAEVYANPTIEWEEMTGLTKYELQLDTVYDWNITEPVTEEDLNSAFVVDENNMWIAGDNGVLLYNDGTGWTTIESNTTEDLNDLWFTGTANGYAVGSGGVVLYYDGTVWTVVDAGTTTDLLAVSFVDENTGWLVGEDGVTIKYESGTWTEETTSNSNDLRDVYALSSDNVWVCGLSKTIGHYDGSEWTFETVSNKDLYSIWFTDANNGWAVGKSGKIVYYNGEEWADQISNVNKDLYSVSFSGGVGYAVGKNGRFVRYDGYWSPLTLGVYDEMHSIYVSGDYGVIAGKSGAIVEKNGDAFSSPYLKTFQISPDSTKRQLQQLLFGTEYYYRMRGIHEEDTSSWSGARKMTTYANTELSSPANDAEGTNLSVNFEWDDYEGVTNYILEIDSNENFTLPRTFGPVQNYQMVNDLVFGTHYYWRVKAQHFADISEWSDVWSFATTNTILLESPEDGATGVLQCPRYTWQKVDGANRYIIWVDTDENFSNPFIYTSDSAFFQCQFALEKKTVYYWKVRGQAGATVSGWSDVWSFETESADAIDENLDENTLRVYPNPNNGQFSVVINSQASGTYQISVVDLVGKVLYQEEMVCKPGENIRKLNLEQLDNGLYLIHLTNDGRSVTRKLFIE